MDNSNTAWRAMAEAVPVGLVLLEGERPLLANREARRLLEWGDGPLPDWLPIPEAEEAPLRVSRGERVLEVCRTVTPAKDRAVTALWVEDRTAQAELEDELFVCKSCLDSVTDQGMLACNAKGDIILYNLPSAQYDDMEQEAVLGRPFTEVFASHKNSAVLEVLRTGEPSLDRDITYVTKDGKEILSFGSAYPIKKDGKLLAAFSVIRFHDSIRSLLAKTLELQKQLLSSSRRGCNGTSYTFEDIKGESQALGAAIAMAKKAAFSPSPVLIYGETGTGKELFAQSIHNAGVGRSKPFIAINCAAIPDTLLESMLFGTVKGAYTGADNTPGLFEQAGNGTIFLDELNSMPLLLQGKLLRALQEKAVRRLGAKSETPIHCRIISSCNRPPLRCVEEKTLRDDLYYRLSVICIDIPPLRERAEDILIIADHFLQRYAAIYGGVSIRMSEDFQRALLAHSWPGNIRELQHAVESALVMLEPGENLGVKHLQSHLRNLVQKPRDAAEPGESAPPAVGPEGDLRARLAQFERAAILEALERNDWNVSRTAKQIGYTRSNLQYRMAKLGIEAEDGKGRE